MQSGRKSAKALNSHDIEIGNLMHEINNLEEGQFIKLHFDDSDKSIKKKEKSEENGSSGNYYDEYYDENSNKSENDGETFILNINEDLSQNQNKDQISIENFQIDEEISENFFAKKYKVVEKKTSKIFQSNVFKNRKKFKQELNVLQRLNSPLLPKLIGYSQNDFKNNPNPTIITEFQKNGSLDSILKMKRSGLAVSEWNDTKKLICIFGIASFMSHLHSSNIIHRDLKPTNVVFDEFLYPKIQGFEFSIQTVKMPSKSQSIERVGSCAYMAPEVMVNEKYSKAGDVYSFALILYEIVTLEKPFFGFNEVQLTKSVISGYRPPFKSDVSDPFKDLIEACWSEKPQKRPTFDDIVKNLKTNSKFITNSVNKDEFFNYVQFIQNKNRINKPMNSFRKISIDFKSIEKVEETDEKNFLNLSLFEKQNLIIKGEFSKIYQIKNKETNAVYAAKLLTIEINKLSKNEKNLLQKEIKILSKLNQNLFLKFIGLSISDFNKRRKPVIVTEIALNGSLYYLLNSERKGSHNPEWTDTKKLIVIYGIASSMMNLHSYEILHRNLNPKSIFLDNFSNPKLGNFGLQIRNHFLEELIYHSKVGMLSNYRYLPPEFFESNKYTKEGDVYSFSLIVYEIITNKIPFNKIKNLNVLYSEIVNNSFRPKFNDKIPESYKKLIECCWSQSPQKRPTFNEIVNLLKSDEGLITKNVNKNEFNEYVKKIENDCKNQENFFDVNTSKNENQNVQRFIEKDDKNNEEMKPISKCCYLI